MIQKWNATLIALLWVKQSDKLYGADSYREKERERERGHLTSSLDQTFLVHKDFY